MASNSADSVKALLRRNEGAIVGVALTALTVWLVRKQFGSLSKAGEEIGKGLVNIVGAAAGEVHEIGRDLIKPITDAGYNLVLPPYKGEVEATGAAVPLMPNYFDSSGRMLESRYLSLLSMHPDNGRLLGAVLTMPGRSLREPYAGLMRKHGGILIDFDMTVIADGKKVYP